MKLPANWKSFAVGSLLVAAIGFAGSAWFIGSASAAVEQSAEDHFVVSFEAKANADPATAWAAFRRIGDWWHSEHTWSGDATNLTFEPDGCWCERWGDARIEHMREVSRQGPRSARFVGALGPLQSMPVNGVMDWTFEPAGDSASTTRITLRYMVTGHSVNALEMWASPVNGVLQTQLNRLVLLLETGSAEIDIKFPSVETD